MINPSIPDIFQAFHSLIIVVLNWRETYLRGTCLGCTFRKSHKSRWTSAALCQDRYLMPLARVHAVFKACYAAGIRYIHLSSPFAALRLALPVYPTELKKFFGEISNFELVAARQIMTDADKEICVFLVDHNFQRIFIGNDVSGLSSEEIADWGDHECATR